MVAVEFRRTWRSHRRGAVAEIGAGLASQLERRGFVTRRPVEEDAPASSRPARKAVVTGTDIPVKTAKKRRSKAPRTKAR